jgi:hypothetical protein
MSEVPETVRRRRQLKTLASTLRQFYGPLCREPLPERLVELLRRLEPEADGTPRDRPIRHDDRA